MHRISTFPVPFKFLSTFLFAFLLSDLSPNISNAYANSRANQKKIHSILKKSVQILESSRTHGRDLVRTGIVLQNLLDIQRDGNLLTPEEQEGAYDLLKEEIKEVFLNVKTTAKAKNPSRLDDSTRTDDLTDALGTQFLSPGNTITWDVYKFILNGIDARPMVCKALELNLGAGAMSGGTVGGGLGRMTSVFGKRYLVSTHSIQGTSSLVGAIVGINFNTFHMNWRDTGGRLSYPTDRFIFGVGGVATHVDFNGQEIWEQGVYLGGVDIDEQGRFRGEKKHKIVKLLPLPGRDFKIIKARLGLL